MKSTINNKILAAGAIGTVFEYYDFLIFGSLLLFFGKVFFPANSELTTFLISLATLGVGFVFRPLGAIIFGRLGDMIGRKKTFMITVTLMGICTTAIGLVPSFASIGWFAPILVILFRLGQGLALGGEYGGSITYIAEHTDQKSRGFYTSLVQSAIHIAFGLTMVAILFTQWALPPEVFAAWGWRLPFIGSIILLGFSIWMRMSVNETPEFQNLIATNNVSTSPIRDSFTDWSNLKFILLSLIGVLAGVGVVVYTMLVYLTFHFTKVLHLNIHDTFVLLSVSQLFAIPVTIALGKLSDKIGRLPIIITGLLSAVFFTIPLFKWLTSVVNPTLAPVATMTGDNTFIAFAIVCIFMLIHALVFAPLAAFLSELFPPKVRYTSMAIPLIGINWFGGFLPLIISAIIAATNDIYAGFMYTIGVAGVSAICSLIFFKSFKDRQLLITGQEIKHVA